MGQVSIFFLFFTFFLKQEIGHTQVTLSLKHFFPEWRLDPLVLKNQCSIAVIAVLHLFSIETAYEPCLTHIINQITIKLDTRI
jgi:hypothetical protein